MLDNESTATYQKDIIFKFLVAKEEVKTDFSDFPENERTDG